MDDGESVEDFNRIYSSNGEDSARRNLQKNGVGVYEYNTEQKMKSVEYPLTERKIVLDLYSGNEIIFIIIML